MENYAKAKQLYFYYIVDITTRVFKQKVTEKPKLTQKNASNKSTQQRQTLAIKRKS